MLKKISAVLSAMTATAATALSASAATVGESAANPATGVEIVWVPVAICGGLLVLAGIVSLVMQKKKKK